MKLAGLKVYSKNVNLSKGGEMIDRLRGKRIKIKALENIKAGDFCFMFTKDENMKDWFLTKSHINDEDVDVLYDYTMMKSDFVGLEHNVVGIKVLPVMEVKGGGIDINEFSDDTLYTETSTEYVLKKQFNMSTPSLPSGLTVYKYALMVSVQIYHTSQVSKVKIDVDDVQLAELTTTTTKTWYDRAKDVDAGTHTVKIYMKTTVVGGTCKVEGIRAVCGIGTTSTADVEIARVETCGEGIDVDVFAGKCYEANVTLTGTLKVDDSDADKKVDSLNVVKGGTEYSTGRTYSSMVRGKFNYFASSSNVPYFARHSGSKVRRAAGI